jgi:hypothetical protein
MRVEVDSNEAHGLLRTDGRVVEVVKVLDQWFGADYSIPCGSTRTDPIGLSRCTQARKLRLSRHNPGSTCVPTGNRCINI